MKDPILHTTAIGRLSNINIFYNHIPFAERLMRCEKYN